MTTETGTTHDRHRPPDYRIHLDDKHGYLTKIDIPAEVAACSEKWFDQTLTRVDDAVVVPTGDP